MTKYVKQIFVGLKEDTDNKIIKDDINTAVTDYTDRKLVRKQSFCVTNLMIELIDIYRYST